MVEYEVFPNAPIVEAVLDIRANLDQTTDLGRLSSFHDRVRETYPEKEERVCWEGSIQFKPGERPAFDQPSGGPIGYLFKSPDGCQVVQVRQDGFSFSRLRPYQDWASLRDEAKRLWGYYAETALPTRVTRLALRYIDRINIPLPFCDFKEYILTVPEIAPSLPQGLAGFFMRLVIPVPDKRATVIVNETIEAIAKDAGKLPLVFDIDVFREQVFPVDDEAIWSEFEVLRDLKNQFFFNSITDKTAGLFR